MPPQKKKVMSLAKIKKHIPKYTPISEKSFDKLFRTANSQTKIVRKMFGKSATPLSIRLLKQLKGKAVYVVEGQKWTDLATTPAGASAKRRVRSIIKLRILDPETLSKAEMRAIGGFQRKRFGKKWPWWPVSYKKSKWSVYAWKCNHYCSGSGCDLLWAFVN